MFEKRMIGLGEKSGGDVGMMRVMMRVMKDSCIPTSLEFGVQSVHAEEAITNDVILHGHRIIVECRQICVTSPCSEFHPHLPA
jgi:hypothetical protein